MLYVSKALAMCLVIMCLRCQVFDNVPFYVLQVSTALAMCLSMCYRCQVFDNVPYYVLQCQCFGNVPEYVLQVSRALTMCLIMCYWFQRFWQCILECVTGFKGFGNIP